MSLSKVRLVCAREAADAGLPAEVGLPVGGKAQGLNGESATAGKFELIVDAGLQRTSLGCFERITERAIGIQEWSSRVSSPKFEATT